MALLAPALRQASAPRTAWPAADDGLEGRLKVPVSTFFIRRDALPCRVLGTIKASSIDVALGFARARYGAFVYVSTYGGPAYCRIHRIHTGSPPETSGQ